MFVALILVPIVALSSIGGVTQATNQLAGLDPPRLIMGGGSILAVISALSWGLGYFGQPHIIVRFMAIRSVKDLKVARRIGMSWMVVSLVGATMVGIVGLAYVTINDVALKDHETIFIFLSTTLFHPLISGFLLAAILAAIMSTISSQLLVTSSSLTEDLYHTFMARNASPGELVTVGRISVVAVAVLAVFLAQNRDSSILSLVSNAWAGFGAAFGPVVLISLFWKRMTRQGALAGIVVGAVTVLVWIYAPLTIHGESLSSHLFEIIPGFVLASLTIFVVSLCTAPPSPQIVQIYETMGSELNRQLAE